MVARFEFVTSCIKRFNESLFEGLKDKAKGRPPSKLIPEQLTEFAKWVEDGPVEETGFSVWTGNLLVEKIWKEFGIKVSNQTVYRRLKELGYTYGKPRPIPGKADMEELVEFQKNFKRKKKKLKNQERMF